MEYIYSLLAVLILAVSHLIVSRLRFLEGPRGHLWQSLAGGAAVSYVMVYILPSLAKKQIILVGTAYFDFFAPYRAYILCLGGFLTYYGVRRMTTMPKFGKNTRNWLLLVGFSVYSALVGYLIGEQKDPGAGFLFLIAVAMSLHFIGTDHEFRRFDPVFYDRVMRWSLAGSLFIGWGMGIAHIISHTSVSAWLAFLSGAIIINTMWEEVPDDRSGRFWPFLFGAVGFAALVLVIYRFQ